MSTEIAPYVGSRAKNVVFQFSAEAIKPVLLIIGTGDPTTEATNELNKPILSTGSDDIGAQTGRGFMLHRLARAAELSQPEKVEMWFIQQEEPSGSQSAGSIDFAGSTGVGSGTYPLYIGYDAVSVTITASMTADEIATAVAAAITADNDLPVTAAVNGTTTSQVDITSKSEGEYWGDAIKLSVSLADETIPDGIAAAFTQPTGGAGTPDIQDALDSMGLGDESNTEFFTRMIASGYGTGATTLDAISEYNGTGNTANGCWAKRVHRPFMNRVGDVTAGSAGFLAALAFGEGRKELDRTNGMISVPGSKSHPAEIAANLQGLMAYYDGTPYLSIANVALTGVHAGDAADRWTRDWDDRNTAALAGISVTKVESGVVKVQTDENFYHPDSVPAANNGYRAGRTVNITRNILENNASAFEAETWQNAFIVTNTIKVSKTAARAKARDIGSVRDQLVTLANTYMANGWMFDRDFTIDKLKEDGAIETRDTGNGFDYVFPFVVSGQLDIIDGLTEFDVSAAVILS